MKKTVSVIGGPIFSKNEYAATDFIQLSVRIIRDVMVNLKISDSSAIRSLQDVIDNLSLALEGLDTSSRDSFSSIQSTASLGNRIADYDKEVLYTYRWGRRSWESGSSEKGDFQKWVEGGVKLPPKGSTINCWESVIIILYLYNAIDKNDLLRDMVHGKSSQNPDNTAKCIERDVDIIAQFLGFWDPKHEVKNLADIQPGDIVSFTSEWGAEMAHVAIAFDVRESVLLNSFCRPLSNSYCPVN